MCDWRLETGGSVEYKFSCGVHWGKKLEAKKLIKYYGRLNERPFKSPGCTGPRYAKECCKSLIKIQWHKISIGVFSVKRVPALIPSTSDVK